MANGAFPLIRAWRRISPSIVPVLAVITALIITIPLMIITRGEGSVIRGLETAGGAYSALLEGSVGLGINPLVHEDDFDQVRILAESQEMTQRRLLSLSQQAGDLAEIGIDNIRRYAEVLARYDESEILPDDETITLLGERITDIKNIGEGRLRNLGPLLLLLDELPRGDVNNLGVQFATSSTLTDEEREQIVTFMPAADEYNDADLLDAMLLINQYRIVRLVRVYEQLLVLDALELDPNDGDGEAFGDIYELASAAVTGVVRVRGLIEAEQQFNAAGITNLDQLANQLRLVGSLYSADVLNSGNVLTALNEDLPEMLRQHTVIRRPNNRVLVHWNTQRTASIIMNTNNTPDDTSDDVPEAIYLNIGGRLLLFFPSSLEATLTRAIPYIIAGLAVAVGFKAGLFNIGAEGQLYAGSILAAFVGFSSPAVVAETVIWVVAAGFGVALIRYALRTTSHSASFIPFVVRVSGIVAIVIIARLLISVTDNILADSQSIHLLIHLPLVLIAGLIGGGIWGMIPGVLKAFTGAHEVINTIMLNFIAIRLVDWLIKSDDPVIMLDTTSSAPRTPFIASTAELPIFGSMESWVFLAAGFITLLVMLWSRRSRLQQDARAVVVPVIWAVVVVVGGYFLRWISVRNNLHTGLIVMFATVWFVDWFLERTTLGFELRTVGANPDAARYAGMNVKWNIILAMTLSGALAGLAGTVEIAGVKHNMEPAFFSGLGFDSIAVALLARNNPRSMILAGILWGALLTGAGLIQVRADISIDLVKIIQALIIMFIAADQMIRWLWRVPEATAEERAAATFSKGWAS